MDALAAREAYLYGFYGIPDKLLSRHPLFYTNLPDARQQEIYEIGKQARDRNIETKWQKMQQKKKAAVLMETDEVAGFDEEIVRTEEDAAAEFGEENFDMAADTATPEAESVQTEDELPVEESAERGIMEMDGDVQSLMANNKRIPNAKERSRVINEAINQRVPVYAEELRAAYKAVKPRDGFMDVCLHGTPYYTTYEHQYRLDTETLYLIISGRKEFQKQNIRLLSCSTGKADLYGNCVAQELADRLGVAVYAPIDVLWIDNGKLEVGDEKLSEEDGFRRFEPRPQRRKNK